MTYDKAIVTCALTGVLTNPKQHPVPVTPEELAKAARQARDAGGRLLNVSDEFVAIASDKHRTAQVVAEAGVPVPQAELFDADKLKLPVDFPYPAVLKPLDGAGSQHTLLVTGPSDEPPPYPWPRRLEQFCSGRAASAAALCGGASRRILPPCPSSSAATIPSTATKQYWKPSAWWPSRPRTIVWLGFIRLATATAASSGSNPMRR